MNMKLSRLVLVCRLASLVNGTPTNEFSISYSRFKRKAAEHVFKRNSYFQGL